MKKSLLIIFCYNVEDHIPAILKEIKLLKLNKNKDFLFIEILPIITLFKIYVKGKRG